MVDPLSKLCMIPHPPSNMAAITKSRIFIKCPQKKKEYLTYALTFSIKFRRQIEIQMRDYKLLGVSSLLDDLKTDTVKMNFAILF